MRIHQPRLAQEAEEESVFVSMTDMTVSFLFVVMLLLAYFANRYSEEETVPWLQFNAVRMDRDSARQQADQLREERQQLRDELRALREQLRHLSASLDQALAALTELQTRAAAIAAERDVARAQATALEEERASILEELHRVAAQLTLLRQELTSALSALARAEDELLTALAERDLARTERAAIERQVAELETQTERLRARIAELEARLEKREYRDPLEVYMTRAAAARRRLLEALQDKLKADFPALLIAINAESDALRFQGEGLFRTSESTLRAEPRRIVETIAARLHELLSCYTFGDAAGWNAQCNPGLAVIEAVQLEGHTDSQGAELSNLSLSTARANSTFAAMTRHEPDILRHENYRGQPVLSVAGYGQMRPVAPNDTVEGRATNRRIDLRIIMHTPAGADELERIRTRLQAQTSLRAQ